MLYQTVDLKVEYGLKGGSLECLCLSLPFNEPKDWKRPAVIVVPGGGYAMTSEREATVVAAPFFARGFQVFVLRYMTATDGVAYPEELLELAASFDYVRKNASAFSVNPDEVFAIGFSAGGHLVADLSCEHMTVAEKYGKPLDCKPTAVGLCYPVIYNEGHRGSYENLLQGIPEEEKVRLMPTLNLDERVTKDTSPAFIWSTFEDTVVPCDNSLRYAAAMKKAGVRFALHIYPFGEHGLATSDNEISDYYGEPAVKHSRRWIDDCCDFFRIYTAEKH
jgi:acetyl esterase/lipase